MGQVGLKSPTGRRGWIFCIDFFKKDEYLKLLFFSFLSTPPWFEGNALSK